MSKSTHEQLQFSFAFHDQLPTINHVVSSIMELSPGGLPSEHKETKLRKAVILAYMNKLIEIWSKAFKINHVQSRKTVKKKIRKQLEIYYNNVANKGKKHINQRQRRMEWRKTSFVLFDIKKIDSKPTDFDEVEKNFYYDQLGSRKMYLSEQVDVEYELKEEESLAKEIAQSIEYEEELSFLLQDDDVNNECTADVLNSSVCLNRSGLARVTHVGTDACTQTENIFYDRPAIRLVRNCTDEIKSTCVEVSVKCSISVQSAVVAVQTVCKSLYNHQFYITKEEAIENDHSLAEYKNEDHAPEQKKRRLEEGVEVRKPPTKRDEYLPYKNVLPTAKTLTDYKQRMAIQAELDAGNALYSKPVDVKCTLHYDTTSRCKIDGEWPAIILNFAGKQRFSLRPLFFAYEDRKQIVSLLVETLKRLALLVTKGNTVVVTANVTANELWENVTVIMTDSVEKNLHIEDGIALELGSQHKPLHVLCKAHTVEALDRSNLTVLGNIEHKLKFREALESTAPSIKSFLRGEKSVSVAAIRTIINFISHDKSATSTNQAALFDHVLESENKVKHISLYQERRFTKLGYSCASILDALPYIQMVLNKTHLNNQHVEIMRMLLDSEFLLSELNVLAFFTHKVSLPLLNAVEIATQDDLCKIFPQLYKDLKNGSMETLAPYIVKYRHIDIQTPTLVVEIELLKEMCYDAAKTIELQCGREYGFGTYNNMKQRATEIFKLSDEERKDLEKNNVICERELGVFDHRAQVSKSRNHKFKAKSLRNDMVLHKASFEVTAGKLSTTILKMLNDREAQWTTEQKELHRRKIEEKLQQGRNASNYTNKLLQKCKSWGGPVTSVEELNTILKKKPDIAEHIIRTELAYYRDTHKADVIANPRLYKINKITHEDRLANLCILLSGYATTETPIPMPNNSDALAILKNMEPINNVEDKLLNVNQICVTLWLTQAGKQWYLGYCQEVLDDDKFVVEHLERIHQKSNLKWKYPVKDDILTVDADQVMMICDITGEWDVHADRNMTFTLRNHELINKKFSELK